jgi:hypothetical protein
MGEVMGLVVIVAVALLVVAVGLVGAALFACALGFVGFFLAMAFMGGFKAAEGVVARWVGYESR